MSTRTAGAIGSLARQAERWWRAPLVFAGILFALSGPAHALGRVDAVFYASLGGVTLGGVGVALGYLALRGDPPDGEEPT